VVKTASLLGLLAISVLAACGGSDAGGGNPGAGGSGAGAGGVSASGAGGATAGTAGTAGASGSTGNSYPMGTVTTCFGTCPLGECDDNMFFSNTPCSSVYTGPIDAASTYCAAGANGAYCLNIGGGARYGVTCSAGVASVMPCAGGCGVVGSGGDSQLNCR
jgi:hypothetical protein